MNALSMPLALSVSPTLALPFGIPPAPLILDGEATGELLVSVVSELNEPVSGEKSEGLIAPAQRLDPA
jgi:hypothetical protein